MEASRRRKNQKRAKRRRYSRCSICGGWATCKMRSVPREIETQIYGMGREHPSIPELRALSRFLTRCEDAPVKTCSEGHVQLLLGRGLRKWMD